MNALYTACLVRHVGRARVCALIDAQASLPQAFSRLADPELTPDLLDAQCRAHGIRLLPRSDPAFPSLLAEIPDPPALLYAQGAVDALSAPAVAVVGARRCTRLGRDVASALGRGLAAAGLTVVSGLALGIDAAAHAGALSAGRTVAVLGSGLARHYPATHRTLARQILESGGSLVSEYSPTVGPRRYHFPERNRLISGLVQGVVVVEASESSGSLITARMALEQGREVMAVPGPVTSHVSHGCHRLLQQGAALVASVDDVLANLAPLVPAITEPARASRELAAGDSHEPESVPLAGLLRLVAPVVTTLDEIVAAARLPASTVAGMLVQLELAGFVEQVPGGYIRRPSRSI